MRTPGKHEMNREGMNVIDRWRSRYRLDRGAPNESHIPEVVAKLAVAGRLVGRVGAAETLRACVRAFAPRGLIVCKDRTICVKPVLRAFSPTVCIEDLGIPSCDGGAPFFLACQELIRSDRIGLSLLQHMGHAESGMVCDDEGNCGLGDLMEGAGFTSLFHVLYAERYGLGEMVVYHLPDGAGLAQAPYRLNDSSRGPWRIPLAKLAPYRVNPDTEIGPAPPVIEIPF